MTFLAKRGNLRWAGERWVTRTRGPGPGVYGFRDSLATVDGAGYLHLKLVNDGTGKVGAEVESVRAGWGYGTYTVTYGASLLNLPMNAVFGGLFLFDEDPAYGHREVDVAETSAWGGAGPVSFDHTYFQAAPAGDPYATAELPPRVSMVVSKTAAYAGATTHRLIWAPGALTFESYSGRTVAEPALLRRDVVTGGATLTPLGQASPRTAVVPVPGSERVTLNLWALADAGIPAVTDVVVESFAFTPA